MDVNILLRGQSNAEFFMAYGALSTVQEEVRQWLGFDGVDQRVNLIANADDPLGGSTINSGTAFLTDWMRQNPDGSWSAGTLEQDLLDTIAGLSTRVRGNPTDVVWIQNETDSSIPGVTAATWTAAVRTDAALVRQAFGQDAAHIPYLFVDAIPTFIADPASNQQIKIGMEQLAADPAFHASIAARFNDANMDSNGVFGDHHMGPGDAAILADRLARTIADSFAAYAQPGSPILQAGGHIDALGPEVVAAQRLDLTDLVLTIRHDAAGGFAPLDPVAASGLGWSVAGPGMMAQATAAWLLDATHLEVQFAGGIPANGLLHYGYGVGRLAGPDGSGHGHAVYDDQGLPIWTPATGVAVDDHPFAA